MSILHKVNKERWTTIDASIINDERLSIKSFGLLVKILSLPDNWHFNESGLQTVFNIGKDQLSSSLHELEETGYLLRKKVRNEKGQFGLIDWFISEERDSLLWKNIKDDDYPVQEIPVQDYPLPENPIPVNPQLYNTNIINTKETNTNILNTNIIEKNTKKEITSLSILENTSETLKNKIEEFIEYRKEIKSPLKSFGLKALISKLDKLSGGDEKTKLDILDESMANGWKGVFEQKNFGNGKSNGISNSQKMFILQKQAELMQKVNKEIERWTVAGADNEYIAKIIKKDFGYLFIGLGIKFDYDTLKPF
jgi:hypothetical protein